MMATARELLGKSLNRAVCNQLRSLYHTLTGLYTDLLNVRVIT